MSAALTGGCHHVGLTVVDIHKMAELFIDALGWEQVGENPDYPAVFVSDGKVMLTLWQAREPVTKFDKNHNIGLHHLALQVETMEQLEKVYSSLSARPDVTIEFSPEFLRQGPAKHMMCHVENIRFEFICTGAAA